MKTHNLIVISLNTAILVIVSLFLALSWQANIMEATRRGDVELAKERCRVLDGRLSDADILDGTVFCKWMYEGQTYSAPLELLIQEMSE